VAQVVVQGAQVVVQGAQVMQVAQVLQGAQGGCSERHHGALFAMAHLIWTTLPAWRARVCCYAGTCTARRALT
jgi:hypothetical protein